jgi:bifunctional ADP-heptose synthase (sugar kinase/adenylyltransferase)
MSLADRLRSIKAPRVLVVGDVFIDRDLELRTRRGDPAFPAAPVYEVVARSERAGGAGAVAAMVNALGGSAVLSHHHPIERKDRYFVGGDLLMRIDHLRYDPRHAPLQARFVPKGIEIVLIADYGKGTLQPHFLRSIIAWSRERRIPCIVDPAPGGDWKRYEGCNAIKCNEHEWFKYGGDRDNPDALYLVTYGSSGMQFRGRDGIFRSFVDARPSNCIDPTGCGDMVLAAIGVCMASGFTWEESCRVAAVAAGIKCERRGAVPVPLSEVILDLERKRHAVDAHAV